MPSLTPSSSQTASPETAAPVVCVLLPTLPLLALPASTGEAKPGDGLIVAERGHVVAADADARRAGVHAGQALPRAQALAPTARVQVRNRAAEAARWEGVLEALGTLTPQVESPVVGVAYLGVNARAAHALQNAGSETTGSEANEAGDPDRQRWQSVIERLGAHAGLAGDRSTARLAAARAGQGHLLVVRERTAFLRRYPVDALVPGGPSGGPDLGLEAGLDVPGWVAADLKAFGYGTLYGVSRLTRRQLTAQFGAEGARLHDLLHLGDLGPVARYQAPPVLGASVEMDGCTPEHVAGALDGLVDEAARELVRVAARRITVRLEGSFEPEDHLDTTTEHAAFECAATERMASRLLGQALTDPDAVLRAARSLLEGLLVRLGAHDTVDRLVLELGALTPARPQQAGLFASRPSPAFAARGVNRRFPGAIRRAVVVYALFPEERVCWEVFEDAA